MSLKGICRHCNEPVRKYQTAIYQVVGYERERDQGGQNHVMRRRRVDGRIWHERCYEQHCFELDGTGEQAALL
jgi:hypothetical protein